MDYHCSHSIAISGDRWPDDLRLSDVEGQFARRACGFRNLARAMGAGGYATAGLSFFVAEVDLRSQTSRPNVNPISIIVQLAGNGVALTPRGSPRPLLPSPRPKELGPPDSDRIKPGPLLPPAKPPASPTPFMLKNPDPPERLPPPNPAPPEKLPPTPLLGPFELTPLNASLDENPLL